MRFYFEEAELWAERKQAVIDKINGMGFPLVLFGKSATSNPAFLDKIQVPVEYVCSNNPKSWGKRHWGFEIVGPDKIQEVYQQYTVLILAANSRQAITSQLQQFPIPPAEIFCLDLYWEEDGVAEYYRKMEPVLEDIYCHLADQESKDAYETMIRYRINRDPRLPPRVALPQARQYFPDSLGERKGFLDSDEIFVDAGAYVGDTVQDFLAASHGRYRSIYAFEPDAANFAKLLESTKGLEHVVCRQLGVGDTVGQAVFTSGGYASRQSAAGEQTVCVDTLDRLLEGVPATYLKMDIEGSECAALRGAKRLIQTYRPKLAICTYHSAADMVMVPKLILEFDPSYHLYFRHYTYTVSDSICYAI